jgi:hypothetical protein
MNQREVSMKVLFLLLVCFASTFSAAAAQSDIKLKIGAKLPRKYVSLSKASTMTAASRTRPFVELTIKDVEYLIAFDEKTREIKYIYTDDDNFRTVNGLTADSEITFTREQLIIFPYWQIRAPATPDGWFPVIGDGASPFGTDYIDKLKPGEKATTEISGFSKGSN